MPIAAYTSRRAQSRRERAESRKPLLSKTQGLGKNAKVLNVLCFINHALSIHGSLKMPTIRLLSNRPFYRLDLLQDLPYALNDSVLQTALNVGYFFSLLKRQTLVHIGALLQECCFRFASGRNCASILFLCSNPSTFRGPRSREGRPRWVSRAHCGPGLHPVGKIKTGSAA